MGLIYRVRNFHWIRVFQYGLLISLIISLLVAAPAQPVSATGSVQRPLTTMDTNQLAEMIVQGTNSLGSSVSISGDWAVVGAPDSANSNGAAYIFRYDPITKSWGVFCQLADPSIAGGGRFGFSVAIYSDPLTPANSVAVVGARDEGKSKMKNAGAVYVYLRGADDSWALSQTLVTNPAVQKGDRFGAAVAVYGKTLVVGAPYEDTDPGTPPKAGSAFIFTMGANLIYTQSGKVSGSQANDRFGAAVAINGTTLLAGSPNHSTGGYAQAGTVYTYDLNSSGTWVFQQNLYSQAPASNEGFGKSLALSRNTAVIGAPGLVSGTPSGAAYIFERVQGSHMWGTAKKKLAGPANSLFGAAVAVEDDVVVVGAPSAASPTYNQGSVLIFSRHDGGLENWGLSGTLTLANGASGDLFGSAMALQGATIFIGAPGRGSQGAAYLYSYKFLLQLDLNGSTVRGFDYGATFTEDSGPVSIVDPNAVEISYAGGWLSTATVTIANLPDGSAESLSASPSGSITADWIKYQNGVLQIQSPVAGGTAPISDFQAVLRSITYNNTSHTPTTEDREIQFIVVDQSGASTEISNQANSIVTIIPVPDKINLFVYYLEGSSPYTINTPYKIHYTLHSPAQAPTGSVTIRVVGKNASCTGGLSSTGQPAGTSIGACLLKVPAAGSLTLVGHYSGDANTYSADSNALNFYFELFHSYLTFISH